MESDLDPLQELRSAPFRRRLPPVARIGILLGFLAIVGGGVGALQGGANAHAPTPRVGAVAPPIALKDLNGKDVTLAAFRGRTVLLNFWAQWCVPCRSEMPAINAAARSHPNVVVLAVDAGDGPALVRQYLQEVPLNFTPLLDPDDRVASLYQVDSIPTSFFIASDGAIRATHVGPMDRATIEADLRQAS